MFGRSHKLAHLRGENVPHKAIAAGTSPNGSGGLQSGRGRRARCSPVVEPEDWRPSGCLPVAVGQAPITVCRAGSKLGGWGRLTSQRWRKCFGCSTSLRRRLRTIGIG